MGSLFIFGNGFDIAHGIPTSYNSFRKWVIEKYPDAIKRRDTLMSIDEYADLAIDDFAAELLIYAMDHACGEDWCDFENALSCINFFDKLPGRLSKGSDEEGITHYQDVYQYLLDIDRLSSAIIKSAEMYWPLFFGDWIKSVEESIDQGIYSPRPLLSKLFSSDSNQYVTFNYTKTLQRVYNIRVVKHIHNRVGQNLVFGHGKTNAEYSEPFEDEGRAPISSSFLNDFIHSFRKDTNKQLRKYSAFLKNLNKSIDRVYSYGFSYSDVDSPYIIEIIKHISPNAIWLFTSYESKNEKEIQNKKSKLRHYGFCGTFDEFDG